MSARSLAVLQWFGLLAAALVWATQLVLGWATTEALCGPGGHGWGFSNDAIQAVLMGVAVAVALVAEVAAVRVWRATRAAEHEGAPPDGRLQFFSTASVVSNVIFLMIILLTGFASIFDVACRQS